MAKLEGQSIASSYEQLLHVDRDGGGNGSTLVDIKDGKNTTTFALQIATDKIQVNGNATITTADNTDTLTLTSTDTDASSGPNLRLYRNSGSDAADSDVLGQIDFDGRNDNDQDYVATRIKVATGDVSDGTEDAQIEFDVITGGTLREYMRMASGSTPSVIFNQDSQDIDFRVLSDNLDPAFFVQGSDGNVGIGTSSPKHYSGTSGTILSIHNSSFRGVLELSGASNSDSGVIGALTFSNTENDAASGALAQLYTEVETSDDNLHNDSGGHLLFFTKPEAGTLAERMRIDSSGNTIIGTHNSNAHRLAIESRHSTVPFGQIVAGSSDQNQAVGLQFVTRDSNGDENNTMYLTSTGLGIGTNSPEEKIHSTGAIVSTGVNDTGATAGTERAFIDLVSNKARIGHFRGTTSAGSGGLQFYTDSVERAKIDASGNFDLNANYIVNEQGRQNHVANTMSSPYYRMDGDGNGFDLGTSANLEPNTGDFSMEAWIYLEAMDSDNHIFASYSSTGIFWKVDDNYLRGLVYDASGNAFTTSNIALATSKWYHVAWTVDRSSATGSKLYINGVESTYSSQGDVTGASGTISSTGNKYLSRTYNNTNDGIYGSMAGFKFYNLALSATEIKELYSGASVPFYYKGANQTDLVTSNWADSGGGTAYTTVSSVSANGFTATETGSSSDTRAISADEIVLVKGKCYRASFDVTLNSGQIPAFGIRESYSSGNYAASNVDLDDVSSGANSIEFVSLYSGTFQALFRNTANTNYTIANFNLVPIGAVAEYDGSGIASDKWLDKSGNDLHGTVSGATVENAPSDDDGLVYEEGTWIPSFNASGSATVTENYYVRIGNWVRCQANLDNIQSGGSGTSVIITGLPYAPKDNTSSGTLMHRYIDVQSANVGVVPYITTSSEVYLYENIDDNNWIDMKWSQINNNDDARITFDYLV